MLLPRYFEDPQTLHVNTTPHHAYFIPFSSAESAVKKTREFSNYFTLLMVNGILLILKAILTCLKISFIFHLQIKSPSLPIGKIMVTIIINIPT